LTDVWLADDTGDSSQPDEDGSEDGDSDEQSTEEFVLDEQLERRTTSTGTQRNNAPPHSLHWAIRSRETTRATNLHRLAGASNLVFIDPSAIRRSASSNAVAAQESPTMATTSSSLARAFGIVLRQISELVGMMAWKFACPASNNYQNYDMTYQEAVQLQVSSRESPRVFRTSSNLPPPDVRRAPSQTNLGLDLDSHGRHRSPTPLWRLPHRLHRRCSPSPSLQQHRHRLHVHLK
jgi:hypothetical protein